MLMCHCKNTVSIIIFMVKSVRHQTKSVCKYERDSDQHQTETVGFIVTIFMSPEFLELKLNGLKIKLKHKTDCCGLMLTSLYTWNWMKSSYLINHNKTILKT